MKAEDKIVDFVMVLAKHWLLILTALVLLFVIPIVGYPYLMATGNPILQSIAHIIFVLYTITCHQLPERSLFLFGYQMTVCSRCFAIYAAFLAGCISFAFIRKRLKIWSLKYFVILCIPMAIDGFAQLFGVPLPRGIGPGFELIWMVESTSEWRIVTGAIFGLASALYVLPYLEEIFSSAPYVPPTNAGQQQQQQPAGPDNTAK
ncbi:DUF2085 domain-containing protein [Methanocella arvoryzae]|nr:DUF2085 domain-containing protein [Methanocella arvoryzae]